jgi:hypothetical protein
LYKPYIPYATALYVLFLIFCTLHVLQLRTVNTVVTRYVFEILKLLSEINRGKEYRLLPRGSRVSTVSVGTDFRRNLLLRYFLNPSESASNSAEFIGIPKSEA